MLNSRNKGISYMVLYAFLSAIGGWLIKSTALQAFAITGFRSLIALPAMLLYHKSVKMRLVINKNTIVSSMIISLVFITFIVANKLTSAANVIILQYTSPVYIVIINFFFLKKKIKVLDLVAVAVSVLAMPLFFYGQYQTENVLGNFIAIISGVLVAVMFILTNKMSSEEESTSALILGHAITAIVCLPIAFANEITFRPTDIFILLGLGILQQAIPHIIYSKAIHMCSSLMCNLISMMEIVLNPLLVYLFIGEKPTIYVLIAMTIMIINITYYTRKRKTEEESQDCMLNTLKEND